MDFPENGFVDMCVYHDIVGSAHYLQLSFYLTPNAFDIVCAGTVRCNKSLCVVNCRVDESMFVECGVITVDSQSWRMQSCMIIVRYKVSRSLALIRRNCILRVLCSKIPNTHTCNRAGNRPRASYRAIQNRRCLICINT